MLGAMRQNVLRTLAGLTLASGVSIASADLEWVPLPLLEDVLSDADEPDWAPEDRARLLKVLTADRRAWARVAVARKLSEKGTVLEADIEDVLESLVRDRSANVRKQARAALVSCLEASPLMLRLQVLSRWALHSSGEQRYVVARALATPVSVPAADVVLAHLSFDSEAYVRRAAFAAMQRRFLQHPGVVADPVSAAISDPDRVVRRRARRLYQRV